MHVATIKLVRIINKAVISLFRRATCAATTLRTKRRTSLRTLYVDRRERRKSSSSQAEGRVHVGLYNSPECIALICALINTHIYISSRFPFSAYYSVDSLLRSVGSVCVCGGGV